MILFAQPLPPGGEDLPQHLLGADPRNGQPHSVLGKVQGLEVSLRPPLPLGPCVTAGTWPEAGDSSQCAGPAWQDTCNLLS